MKIAIMPHPSIPFSILEIKRSSRLMRKGKWDGKEEWTEVNREPRFSKGGRIP